MASESRIVRMEQFNQVNGINRSLYFVLVQSLARNPVESILVTALWIWLSRAGFNNVVLRISLLPHALINELANEAEICIDCINAGARFLMFDEPTKIPLTQSLLGISLQFFFEHRVNAMHGMGIAINEVCLRDLIDIIDHALNRNTATTRRPSQMNPPTVNNSVVPSYGDQVGYAAQSSNGRPPSYETSRERRTMFVTFSRGYPVAEVEVRYFFNRIFGDCIEAFHMQEVRPNVQALYARIVFYEAALIDFILNGLERVKFSINGKHVWMRKFVPRGVRSTSSRLLSNVAGSDV